MNVYFACSITGGREYEAVYQTITASLLANGHDVPTAHLADPQVKALEAEVDPRQVYERDVAWINVCDALVAEVSTPSHGVGYEVAFALSLGKPVLCVYHEGLPVSKMLTGNTNPRLRVQAYQNATAAVETVYNFLNDCR